MSTNPHNVKVEFDKICREGKREINLKSDRNDYAIRITMDCRKLEGFGFSNEWFDQGF